MLASSSRLREVRVVLFPSASSITFRATAALRTPLLGVVDQVLAVDRAVAERAKEIVLGRRQISARDAVHLAVMEQHGIEQILTFDSGFDGFPGITRLS